MNNKTKLLSVFAVLLMVGSALVCLGSPIASGEEAPLVTSNDTVVLDGSKDAQGNKAALEKLGQKDIEKAWESDGVGYIYHMSGINFSTSSNVAVQITNGLTIDVVGENTLSTTVSNWSDEACVIASSGNLNIVSNNAGSVLNIKFNNTHSCCGISVEGYLTVIGTVLNVKCASANLTNITESSYSSYGIYVSGGAFTVGNYAFKAKTVIAVEIGDVKITAGSASDADFRSYGIYIQANDMRIAGDSYVFAKTSDFTIDIKKAGSSYDCESVGFVARYVYTSNSNYTPIMCFIGGDVDFTSTLDSGDFTLSAKSRGMAVGEIKFNETYKGIKIRAESGTLRGNINSGESKISSIGIECVGHSYLYYCTADIVSGYATNNCEVNDKEESCGLYCSLLNLKASVLNIQSAGCKHSASYGIHTTSGSGKITGDGNDNDLASYVIVNCDLTGPNSTGIRADIDSYVYPVVSASKVAIDFGIETPVDQINTWRTTGLGYYLNNAWDIVYAGPALAQAPDFNNVKRVFTCPNVGGTSATLNFVPYIVITDALGFTEIVKGSNVLEKTDCYTPAVPSEYGIPPGKVFVSWEVTDFEGNSIEIDGGLQLIPLVDHPSASHEGKLLAGGPLLIKAVLADEPTPEPSNNPDNSGAMIAAGLVVLLVAGLLVYKFVLPKFK